MIGWAGQWTRTPSATYLQPKNEMLIFGLHSTSDDQQGWLMDSNLIHHPSPGKKMKCSYLDYIQLLMISRAGWWTWIPSATPLQPKNEVLIFGLCSTSDDQPGWSKDSNPICNLSRTKKIKVSFLVYIQLLMISRAGRRTQTPSVTPLKPKKWNAHFCITFNFWWLAGLVIGLKLHPPAFSSQKNEMLIFGLHLPSDDQLGWSMDSNHMCHISPGIKWNAYFWITFNFWWSAVMVDGLKPHLPPLSSQKNEMIIFGLCSTSDDRRGWLMDLSPICHPSPAKKMKCSFLDYVQLLMIGWAGRWTQTPSTTPGQEKNDMLIFVLHSTSHDQLGWLMDSNPICNPYPVKKMKCSFLDYIQLLMIGQAGWLTWTPSATHLQPEKWNACFWITFKFWWLAGLVDELKPHLPPLSSQKNEMLIFGLRSTSDDWPGWSMDANPICHPSPAKSEMLIFGLRSTSDDRLSWLMDSNPIYNLSPAKKMKISFLDYVQLLMISRVGWWTQTPFATPLLQKNEMLIFGLRSTSDDWQGWSLDSNPMHHSSPTNKMKCLFLYYVQLLMIGLAGWWTQTPSANFLQPNNEMLIFVLCSTSDDQLGWLMDSNPICNLSPAKKVKCSFLYYVQLLMISQAGRWTRTTCATSLQA